MTNVFIVEGIDRLGKDALIDEILQNKGFFQEIHFSKPQRLKAYEHPAPVDGVQPGNEALFHYQAESFRNSMILAKSGARLIFNRSWIGEAVYAPIYRKTDGNYVFNLEKSTDIGAQQGIRLILLVEDFDRSTHFKSDGDSFDDSKRREEQTLFMKAFHRSAIADKRVICVTGLDGGFKSKNSILLEALA